MQKLIRTLIDHSVPVEYSREDWKLTTSIEFAPYFRRQASLKSNLDTFMVELRNLAHLIPHPEHLDLFRWCLSLHRRVLRKDRAGAYRVLHSFFGKIGKSDARWMNIFQVTNPLEASAAPQDLIFQIFETIDQVAEGCFKPQMQVIYAFAVRDATGAWPANVAALDFGALVADFPQVHKGQVSILLNDPDLNISVNQWRNIAAHKSYQLVGPRTVQVTFGKGKIQTRNFGIQRLRSVSRWLLTIHRAVRLANTIIFVEHMKEIVALGMPIIERPMSAAVARVAHDLSTVGFQAVDWKERKQEGLLTLTDRLNRIPAEALVHASQQLVQLSVGILADVSTRTRITKVSISLNLPNGDLFGTATVAVSAADAFSLRKMNLREYMEQIQWRKNSP
jgi:hypothetical protein